MIVTERTLLIWMLRWRSRVASDGCYSWGWLAGGRFLAGLGGWRRWPVELAGADRGGRCPIAKPIPRLSLEELSLWL